MAKTSPFETVWTNRPTSGEWTTTAAKDGDCAIVRDTTLIGVGATVQQTLNIVADHNAALTAEREKLREQLAACSMATGLNPPKVLSTAIAAAQKPLVDALKRIAYEPQGEATASPADVLRAVENIAKDALDDAALAQVKEGK